MLFWILMMILIVMLIASLPMYPYSREWRYRPSGAITVILVILLIVWLMGWFPGGPAPTVAPVP